MILKFKSLFLLCSIFIACANICTGQSNDELGNTSKEKSSIDSIKTKPFFAGYPLVFFTPETRWGFGAAAVYNFFPGKKKSQRPSQTQVGAAYTLNKQLLSFCFYNIFLDEDKHNLFGEIAYYDYFFQFFGVGNQTKFEDEELYSAKFPRLQFNYLRKLKKNFYLGGYYHFDNYKIVEIAPDGVLDNSDLTGKGGSIISRLGILARYDSRDNIFYPSTGIFTTIELGMNSEILGASSAYQVLSFDFSYYHSIKNQILAFNFWTGSQFGNVPFQELLSLGGGRKSRGIIKGRFRDEQVMLAQVEYRFPIYKRFSGTAFSSYGNVFTTYDEIFSSQWKLNYGLGLRFLLDKKNKTNLRVDFALGSDQSAFYFTVNEAF